MRDLRKSSHRRFQVVLIKPSHYDDDGYVIQWLRSLIPSNSLAAVYSLIADAIDRSVLGPDIEADLSAVDECHTRVSVAKIIRQFERNGGFGMVGLVGVQSNQFPRALDIARPLRAAGIPVVIGGFHVSGCLAMIPEMPADLQEALDLGISLFAGELENRVDDLLRDVVAGRLSPIYNYLNDLPGIEAAPPPILPRAYIRGTVGHYTSFDAGRGCPFQCSFCTIINVQGRTSRRRSADDIEKLIRLNWAQGVRRFFITDDNFARNKDWEPIFDRMIRLRVRDKIKISCIIQVDTLCHKIPHFIDKAAKAGVRRVFIGLENINPDNLLAAKKRQNKIVEYREMLLEWKKHGIMTYAGYILGFPADTPESIRRDIEIIKAELPLDIIEFFFLTPLPGSEDHKALWLKDVAMDPDMNKYDLEHVCTAHGQMSGQRMGGDLSRGVEHLLHPGAYRNDPPPREGDPVQRRADACQSLQLRHFGSDRGRPSAAGRCVPDQATARPAAGIADRADDHLLSALRLRDRTQTHRNRALVAEIIQDPAAPGSRTGRRLHGSRAGADHVGRDRHPRTPDPEPRSAPCRRA